MAAMADAPAEKALRVHPLFPTVPHPSCKEPAAAFFHCFSKKSVMLGPQDDGAAERALRQCQEQMAVYDACLDKFIAGGFGDKKR